MSQVLIRPRETSSQVSQVEPWPLTVADVQSCRPEAAELRRATRHLRWKALAIILVAIGSYLGLVVFAHGLVLALPFAAILVIALTTAGTSVMHDANHGAFGGSARLNRTLAYSADVLGASSWLWRRKHNLIHHGNTNVVGVDTDIEQLPFARLAPGQAWRPWHRYQHIYMWGLYGFLTAQWMLFSDFASLFSKRIGSQAIRQAPRRRDVALLLAGKLIHVGWALALPFAFHRWWAVLAFYFACSWLVGFVLSICFQLAHCVDIVDFAEPETPRRGDDFVAHQLRTTADVRSRSLLSRLTVSIMGGLDHQIEHHLAPGVPHTAYKAMAERLSRLCAARGVHLRVHQGVWAALRSHTRWLRSMGRPDVAFTAGHGRPDAAATATLPAR